MTRCPYASTCNYPEGDCAGLCLHRLIRPVEQRMAIEYAGPEPEDIPTEKPMTRFRFALNTFRLYRKWGCSVRQSLKRAAHEFRKFHAPDPFKEHA